MSYSGEVLADSPVGYWRLNDTSGTTAVDSSGGGHDGTYSGSFTLNQPTLLVEGSGASVNFTGGQMAVPDTLSLRLGTGAVSYEIWVNLTSTAAYASLVDDTQRGYSLFLNANGGAGPTRAYLTYGNSANAANEITLSTGIATAELDHIAVTSDGAGNAIVYRNGVSVFTTASQDIGATNSASGVTIFANPSGGGGAIQGQGQELAVYSTVLSPARVAAHYTAGITFAQQFIHPFNAIPFMGGH